MHITVDRDRCVGSGNCVLTLPLVFDQDDERGLVVLRAADPPDELADRIHRAADLCPAAAIAVS